MSRSAPLSSSIAVARIAFHERSSSTRGHLGELSCAHKSEALIKVILLLSRVRCCSALLEARTDISASVAPSPRPLSPSRSTRSVRSTPLRDCEAFAIASSSALMALPPMALLLKSSSLSAALVSRPRVSASAPSACSRLSHRSSTRHDPLSARTAARAALPLVPSP